MSTIPTDVPGNHEDASASISTGGIVVFAVVVFAIVAVTVPATIGIIIIVKQCHTTRNYHVYVHKVIEKLLKLVL